MAAIRGRENTSTFVCTLCMGQAEILPFDRIQQSDANMDLKVLICLKDGIE